MCYAYGGRVGEWGNGRMAGWQDGRMGEGAPVDEEGVKLSLAGMGGLEVDRHRRPWFTESA